MTRDVVAQAVNSVEAGLAAPRLRPNLTTTVSVHGDLLSCAYLRIQEIPVHLNYHVRTYQRALARRDCFLASFSERDFISGLRFSIRHRRDEKLPDFSLSPEILDFCPSLARN